ncbi:MAG: DUF4382 domain-containing protein [Balneolaceae bacterium]|nr:MAG: DUF4382 domain-containing protein [Balneolaceae bacterium]
MKRIMKAKTIVRNRILSLITGIAVLLFMSVSLSSCDIATNQGGKGTLKVVMVDAPGNYEEVWVHIVRVEVNNANDEGSGWIVISEPDESYDLLELINGANVVLGEAELDEGTYRQIRLILGNDNYVVIGGQSYPMMTPSAQQTGIKLNVNAEIEAGFTYTLLLDFDAQRSVVKRGATGTYLLKPVIRAVNTALTGNITGMVEPAEPGAWVYAIAGSDTVSTTRTIDTGEFTLVGLIDGFYSVSVEPVDEDYESVQIGDVEVKAGQVTNLGVIELTSSE